MKDFFRKLKNRIICFFSGIPYIAENGDVYGEDNDGDGKIETYYMQGYRRKDGVRVRSHYRAE